MKKKSLNFCTRLRLKFHTKRFYRHAKSCIERLAKAIDNKEKIVIYGDFDADGVTSTSLLYRTFTHLGADVNYFIPDREKQGHGLDTKALGETYGTSEAKSYNNR